jgi:hypothetical protein
MRVTDDEYAQLIASAELADLTPPAYMRSRCLNGPMSRARRRPSTDMKALASALGQLHKVGSNINQIARAMNSGEAQPPDMETAFAELRAVCGVLMKALEKKRRR